MEISTGSSGSLFLAEIVIIEHLIAGFVGMTLWKHKRGDPGGGLIVALILGILGVFILGLAKPGQREMDRVARTGGLVPCPHCAEPIKREARVCKYCRRDVAPSSGTAV